MTGAKMIAGLSLRVKLIAMITVLVTAVALFLVIFFPARMEGFSRRWLERRAVSIAGILARSAAPGLEFDDASTVSESLGGLAATPEVLYAVVRRANGTTLAAFRPERVPDEKVSVGDELEVRYAAGQLRVDAPVRAKGGAAGTISVGFSLAELEQEKRGQRTAVAGVSLAIWLLGLAAAFFVGTIVARPLRQMTEVALRIAKGDLSQPELEVRTRDEVGQMAIAFNQMLRSLRELAATAERIGRGELSVRVEMEGQVADAFNRMVENQRMMLRQISEISAHLGAAAEIYASAQQQETASTQQAGGVEEVSRTMQSLLDSASHIADSARGVLDNAERTKLNTEATSEKVSAFSRHTSRIAEILEVIRDIADRSDLLALNASLEGTRAGEAGRAFSLVANEMRRLAERVTASVQDVKSLLSDVGQFGSSSVMAADEGRKLADSTTESARQITLVTQQQRTATEQVLQSMRQISSLLSQTVASTEQARAAFETLKTMADRLASVVGQFKVGESSRERAA